MSCFMQPLFVSPMINIPDVFSVAEVQLKKMSKEEAASMIADEESATDFLKEHTGLASESGDVQSFVFVESYLIRISSEHSVFNTDLKERIDPLHPESLASGKK